MKILFVTDLYPIKNNDSTPRAIENFAIALSKLGHEIEILKGNFLINSLIRGHKIYKNGIYENNNIKIYNKNFILPFLNCNFHNEYDLIISHMPAGHLLADKIKNKTPSISIIHQSDDIVIEKYNFYFKKRLKKALKNSTLIGARNKNLAEKFNANFILPSFIKKENLKGFKILPNKKLKIITLSKLIKRKNIDKVIMALNEIDFDYEYSIYGEGSELKNLQKLIKKHNLQEKIKIYPHIQHEKIWEKLDENNVFILPSEQETFGISYLEAMARGLITIGTKNTGIDGVIENNKNGYLINPNKNEIKDILEKIATQDQSKIIKNTMISIQNYEQDKIIKKYDEIIKKILGK